MNEEPKNKLTIYLQNPREYRNAIRDCINLWYKHYGIYQSKGNILLIALFYLRDALKRTDIEETTSKESSLSFKYARIGK